MKVIYKFNLVAIFILVIACYIAYYFLLKDNLHSSISSIIANSQALALKQHLLVLGIIPIYIALVIFGSGVIGFYIGSIVQRKLLKSVIDKLAEQSKKSV